MSSWSRASRSWVRRWTRTSRKASAYTSSIVWFMRSMVGGPPNQTRCQICEGSRVEGGMTDQTSTQPLPVLHVANAHFVTPFLAVGGDLANEDAVAVRQSVELVVDGGVTHILDVRQEADDSDWWAPVDRVDYLWAGIDD